MNGKHVGDDYKQESSHYSEENQNKLDRAYMMILEVIQDQFDLIKEEDQSDLDSFYNFVKAERKKLEQENRMD